MDLKDAIRLLRGRKETAQFLREQSIVEGLLNGNKRWLAVGAVVWGGRALRKALGTEEKVLMREILRPGETVVVTEVPLKPTRKQRRRAKRSAG